MLPGAGAKKRTKTMIPALQELTEQTDWESILSSGQHRAEQVPDERALEPGLKNNKL